MTSDVSIFSPTMSRNASTAFLCMRPSGHLGGSQNISEQSGWQNGTNSSPTWCGWGWCSSTWVQIQNFAADALMGVDPIWGKSCVNHGPTKMRPLQQSSNWSVPHLWALTLPVDLLKWLCRVLGSKKDTSEPQGKVQMFLSKWLVLGIPPIPKSQFQAVLQLLGHWQKIFRAQVEALHCLVDGLSYLLPSNYDLIFRFHETVNMFPFWMCTFLITCFISTQFPQCICSASSTTNQLECCHWRSGVPFGSDGCAAYQFRYFINFFWVCLKMESAAINFPTKPHHSRAYPIFRHTRF